MTMIHSAHRIATIVLLSSSSSSSLSSSSVVSAFIISSAPPSIMSKRSSSSSNSPTKKVAKQQQSLTGFFTSAKSKLDDDDSSNNNKKYKIFCDLDGVLVDFDSGVKSLFNGKSPNELAPGLMWSRISSTPSFYANLPWTSDGKLLWRTLVTSSSLASLDVLTGVPRNFSSRAEKFEWCQRELLMTNDGDEDNNTDKTTAAPPSLSVNHVDMAGKKYTHTTVSGQKKRHINNKKDQIDNNSNTTTVINIITCWSKNKHYESKKNHILIDDRLSLREAWEGNGGVFIHHTSAVDTIRVLRERGILTDESLDDSKGEI